MSQKWYCETFCEGNMWTRYLLRLYCDQQPHYWAYTLCVLVCAQSLSRVQLLAIPWTVAHQAPPEKTTILKDTCNPMFIAAIFSIVRTWKQPRCPSTDEWTKKLYYLYTVECYSAIKRNKFESVLVRWMNLELLIQSEEVRKRKTNVVY